MPQMEGTECGAASLAMVLGFHGHHAPLAEVRQACGVSRDGANALSVLRAARAYGLESEAVKVEMEHLGDLPLPAILHWDFTHFLVLETLRQQEAILVDPAAGRHRLGLSEVAKHFTGIALVFSPDEGFVKKPSRFPSLAPYKVILASVLPSLGQILGASIIIQFLGMLFPIANQILLDKVITPRQEPWLWGLAFGLGGAALGRILLGAARAWVVQSLQTSLDLGLMTCFLQHLVRLPIGFFLQRQAGDLVQRVQSSTQVQVILTSQFISTILDVFLLLGLAVLMVSMKPTLGAIIILLGFVRVGLLLHLRDRSQQAQAMELAAAGKESGALVEALSAIETIKACGAESRMVSRWSDRMVGRLNGSLDRRRLEIFSRQAMQFLQGLTLAAVLGLGGLEVMRERMTIGVFAAFLALQDLFMGPLESFLGALVQVQYLQNHLSRLDDVLETEQEPCGTLDPGRLQGDIRLENVSFAYSPSAPDVVQNINLHIRPGEKVALVGPSGAGKSTLARLILGLHLPTQGSIRFDGRDLRELNLTCVRRQVGVVLQETFFFDDTIRSNLSLNRPDIPLDRLRLAAQQACILNLVDAQPRGFDARMGENGNLFSGGQRQRLSLARALAHEPAILLLDEATSALDLETEAELHVNLAGLGCSRIVIAHRLATVRDADLILVLERGRVVQQGTFQQLSDSEGLFHQLLQAMEHHHA